MTVIKNTSLQPESVPNDGGAVVDLQTTVLTPRDQARIERVALDLSSLGGPTELLLTLDDSRCFADTAEGVYRTSFPVPPLAEPGRHDLPLAAVDSTGESDERSVPLEIQYRRRDYPAGLLNSENIEAFTALSRQPVVEGNRIESLMTGQEAMQKRLDLIRGARRQINLQTYLMSNEGGSGQVLAALLDKAGEGVEVNIIVNSDTQLPYSPISTLRMKFNRLLLDLQSIGQKWEALKQGEPESDWLKILSGTKKETRGINLLLVNGQTLRDSGLLAQKPNHRAPLWLQKTLRERRKQSKNSEDGDWLTAFKGPGGLPALPLLDYAIHEKMMIVDGETAIVGGRNLDDRYFYRWSDEDLYLEGPIVAQIQRGFLRNYGEFSRADEKNAPATELYGSLSGRGSTKAQFIQSRPWINDYQTLHALVSAIQMSRSHIYICSQYVILPDNLLRDALIDAARRGVDVRILTNSHATSQEVGFATSYYISINYFAKLLAAGIRLYEVKGHEQENKPQPYLHSKEFLIDGELAAIGSFNLSIRSCYIESENLINIFDPEVTRRREKRFTEFLREKAVEITPVYLQQQQEQHKNKLELARYVELLY